MDALNNTEKSYQTLLKQNQSSTNSGVSSYCSKNLKYDYYSLFRIFLTSSMDHGLIFSCYFQLLCFFSPCQWETIDFQTCLYISFYGKGGGSCYVLNGFKDDH